MLKVIRHPHRGVPVVNYYKNIEHYDRSMYEALMSTSDDWNLEVCNNVEQIESFFGPDFDPASDNEQYQEMIDFLAKAERIGYPVMIITRSGVHEMLSYNRDTYHGFLREWDGHDLRRLDFEEVKD